MIRYKRLNESFDPVKTVSMQFRRTLEDSKYGKALRKIDSLDDTVAIVEEVFGALYKECEEAGVKIIPDAKWKVTGSYRDYDPNDYKFHCEFYFGFRVAFDDQTSFSRIRGNLEKLADDWGKFSGDGCLWETYLGTHEPHDYAGGSKFSKMTFSLRIHGLIKPDGSSIFFRLL